MITKYIPTSKKYLLPVEYFDHILDVSGHFGWADDLKIEKVEFENSDWILRDIPKEFRSALSYMAYERGHSAGQSEVDNILESLVSDLKPAIEAFRKSLTK